MLFGREIEFHDGIEIWDIFRKGDEFFSSKIAPCKVAQELVILEEFDILDKERLYESLRFWRSRINNKVMFSKHNGKYEAFVSISTYDYIKFEVCAFGKTKSKAKKALNYRLKEIGFDIKKLNLIY